MSGSTAGVRNRCPGNSVNITLLPTLLQYTLGKNQGCHPDTCHTVYTINQNLKIDSRLDSKKSLNTPRVASGSLATEPRTTWQLRLRAHVTSTEPSHCATPHCSHPLTAPRDTSPQTNTVIPTQINTQQRSTVLRRAGIILCHPPQESKPVSGSSLATWPLVVPAADKPPFTPTSTVPFYQA